MSGIRERMRADPSGQIITRPGEPLPRVLPDGRWVRNTDQIKAMTDAEVMEWLDNVEGVPPEELE